MIQRILTALLSLALFAVALFVTSMLVATALAAGLLLWSWAWWRSRHAPVHRTSGRVIEGEYRIIERK